MTTMRSIQGNKEKIVDAILDNTVYMPESSMRLGVRERLLKLPEDTLGCLKLIIDIKMTDAGTFRQAELKEEAKMLDLND